MFIYSSIMINGANIYLALNDTVTNLNTILNHCEMSFVFLYFQLDTDNDQKIDVAELDKAFEITGYKLPAYRIRDLIAEVDSGKVKDGKLDFTEFMHVSIQ